MAKEIVSDELWAVIQPLLPPPKPRPKGGRPPIPDRKVLTGILFVLMTGIPGEMLPKEMGCGSGMTCWRRLRSWQQAGGWKRLHQALLDRLGEADKSDGSQASLGSATAPAPGGRSERAESDGSRQTGDEAPSCGRQERPPVGGYPLGSQRPRQPDDGSDPRCH